MNKKFILCLSILFLLPFSFSVILTPQVVTLSLQFYESYANCIHQTVATTPLSVATASHSHTFLQAPRIFLSSVNGVFFFSTLFQQCTRQRNADSGNDNSGFPRQKHFEEQAIEASLLSDADSVTTIRDTSRIIAVGDVMLGSNYPDNSNLPPNDGKGLLDSVTEIIRKGDVSFANLEGVLLSGHAQPKEGYDSKYSYRFKMPDHYAEYLLEAGFTVLSIANNHSFDFGRTGASNTQKVLRDYELEYAGLDDCPYTIFTRNNLIYGFAAFAPNTGTVHMNDYNRVREIISHLDSLCNIVIVSFHGGAEGSKAKHVTKKREFFLEEDRGNPYEFARIAIDAGADVVLGHGPHVTRAIDLYKDRFIAYSLGNFATYGRFNLSGPNGICPIIEIDLDSDGTFLRGQIHSIKQVRRGMPVSDKKKLVLKEIITLTQTDFPDSDLHITPDGEITKKIK